jgi:hypothetical protein
MKILYYQLEDGTTIRFIYLKEKHATYPYVAVAEDFGGLTGFIAGSGAVRLENKLDIHKVCNDLRRDIPVTDEMLFYK